MVFFLEMIAHTSFLYERRTISRKLFDDYFYMMKIPEMLSIFLRQNIAITSPS